MPERLSALSILRLKEFDLDLKVDWWG